MALGKAEYCDTPASKDRSSREYKACLPPKTLPAYSTTPRRRPAHEARATTVMHPSLLPAGFVLDLAARRITILRLRP
jgi:hypothetical protein